MRVPPLSVVSGSVVPGLVCGAGVGSGADTGEGQSLVYSMYSRIS